MEPKDKAKELIDKYTQIFYPNRLVGESKALAIQISNDIVDEVIYNITDMYHLVHNGYLSTAENEIQYWKEVKNEINKK